MRMCCVPIRACVPSHRTACFIFSIAMPKPWKDDAELFELARRDLYTAVVGDIMDEMGLTHQFLPPQIRPLHSEMVVVGPAMTVLSADVTSVEKASEGEPP